MGQHDSVQADCSEERLASTHDVVSFLAAQGIPSTPWRGSATESLTSGAQSLETSHQWEPGDPDGHVKTLGHLASRILLVVTAVIVVIVVTGPGNGIEASWTPPPRLGCGGSGGCDAPWVPSAP